MARGVVAATGVFTALVMTAGCSGSDAKREYDVPRALCGVPLDPGLVSPLLPAGKEIKVGKARPVPSRENCRVDVDGHWAMTLNLEWWEEDVAGALVASGNPQLERSRLSPDGNYYSGTGAVTLVKGCTNPAHAGQSLYTSSQISDPDLGDTPAMRKLATAFTEAVGRSAECP